MNEPMQPSIVADYERIAEDQMDDTCEDCGAEVDMRLLELFVAKGSLAFAPIEKWLCHECYGKAEAEVENYWADIGEDR